jgi:glycosyltransferase involved in cell wall biosynthesis
MFTGSQKIEKNDKLVISVARIEGIKNQLNLIKALNGTAYKLLIIGAPAPNQVCYYNMCKKTAKNNITFIDHLPQHELVTYYEKAKVHVLPSWFETTGLSSLEAAAMGCNVVITDKGDAKEYFGDDGFYCDPASPLSIYDAVEKAASAPLNISLKDRVQRHYSWKQASLKTLQSYYQIIPS